MSQNDFVVANADGATVRGDLNSALQALASQNSGATEPTTTYAHMIWVDTTANLIKIRNAANNAWVTVAVWNGVAYVPAGNNILNGGTAGGTANAQTLTPAVALGAYAAGVAYTFKPVATNTSGAVTIAISALATRNVKKFIGGAVVALAVGDLVINSPSLIIDDGTQLILINNNTFTQGADVASASTLNLDTATGDYVNVTGTTGITAVTLSQGRQVTVQCSGIATWTNGASLILPGGVDFVSAAGDCLVLRGEASGVVRCTSYALASGKAIVASGAAGRILSIQHYFIPDAMTVTITNASPGVLTITTTGMTDGAVTPPNGYPLRLTTTGGLPTGLATGTTYYVVNSGSGGVAKFQLSATKGGAAINTSSAGSGTQKIVNPPYVKGTNNPTNIKVRLIGGGNGGSNINTAVGGYAEAYFPASTCGSSETLTVALGATGGATTAKTQFGTTSILDSINGGSLNADWYIPAVTNGEFNSGGIIGSVFGAGLGATNSAAAGTGAANSNTSGYGGSGHIEITEYS